MKGSYKFGVVIFFFSLMNLSIFGQTKDSSIVTLTLEKAINLALDINANLKVANLEVQKSQAQIVEARSYLFPQLNASGQYIRNIEKPVIFLPPGGPFGGSGGSSTLEIGYDNSYIGTLGLTMPLFSNQVFSGLSIAKLNNEINSENLRAVKSQTISDVTKSFLSVLLTREYRDLLQKSLDNALENLNNIKSLNAQGVVADYDLLRAEVQVENLRPQVLQAEDNYQIASDALKITIGLDASVDIEVVGNLTFDSTYQTPNTDEITQQVLMSNPDLQKLEKQTQLTKESIGFEKSAIYPSLALFGNYQYQTQANDFKISDYQWVSTFAMGVQLQIPIFTGFKTKSRIEQAQVTNSQVEEQRRAYNEAIQTQVKNVLFRIEQARHRVQVQTKSIEQAEKGYEIARVRYQNGIGTQLEVNDADLALRQVRANYIQAVYDFQVAIADLQQLTGNQNF
ncbi:MAG: TolC family protein [Ignavibacterium sp.]